MPYSKTRLALGISIVLAAIGTGSAALGWLSGGEQPARSTQTGLVIRQDQRAGTLSVYRAGRRDAILTQNARPDARPYLHPIAAPDGQGMVTEFSPEHHKHQTGLYWGFTRVNGRDFFHNPHGDYWRRVSMTVTAASGDEVRWQTVYDLLDEAKNTILTETLRWSMREDKGRFLLDLEWRGEARTDVTIGKYDYGGLFLRMPWREGMPAEVVNAARQRNERAEGQRAMWIDVGMQVDGRKDLVHVALLDHPDNAGYPQAWRVDGQFGVGAARSRAADWTIKKGETEVIRNRLLVYTGNLNDVELTNALSDYGGDRSTCADAGAVGYRAERGTRGEVPHAGAGGIGDDDGAGVRGHGLGGRTDDPAAHGLLLGRPRSAVGGREPGLRDQGTRLLESGHEPHPDSWKTPTATASPTAGRCSSRGSFFRRRLPSDSTASSSAHRPTCCSCPTGTAMTGRTRRTSKSV